MTELGVNKISNNLDINRDGNAQQGFPTMSISSNPKSDFDLHEPVSKTLVSFYATLLFTFNFRKEI